MRLAASRKSFDACFSLAKSPPVSWVGELGMTTEPNFFDRVVQFPRVMDHNYFTPDIWQWGAQESFAVARAVDAHRRRSGRIPARENLRNAAS